MGMEFAPTWLRQVSPLLHKTTLTTGYDHIVAVTWYIGMLNYFIAKSLTRQHSSIA